MGVSDGKAEHDRPLAGDGDGRIHLGREAPIRLGALVIEPGLRRVAHDDGREEVVEPRVMQVLVALARSVGVIITRDDLLASCWHGVVVGEDAITRVISRLRRLADGIGEGQLKLETITKVGYRLVPTGPAPGHPPSDAGPAVTAGSTVEPLLAVLAFDNLSRDEDVSYFCDGMSEEILQTVARGAALRVVGRGSSFQFRGADKAAAHVASVLKATHVLDGSVRRSGDRVRIAAHLIECAGETTLWSDRFDRDLTDIFALQDEIAAAVAAALRIAFAPAAKSQPVNAEAYDLYLRALAEMGNLRNPATNVAIVELLEQATALSPRFARAWSCLATMRARILKLGPLGESFALMRAKVVEAAETAIRLEPDLGEPYQALSELEPIGHYLVREGFQKHALSHAPNDPRVLYFASIFAAEVGRTHEALGYVRQAHDLDPMNLQIATRHAIAVSAEGRHEESSALWDKLRVLWPNSEDIVWYAINSAIFRADWSRLESYVEVAREMGVYTDQIKLMVWFASNLRHPDPISIKVVLDRTREDLLRTGTVTFDRLIGMYRLGQTDETFDLIEQSSFNYIFDPELPSPLDTTTAFTAIFNVTFNSEMMRDPRFPRLCAKLGLCDYWVKTDRWPGCAEAVAPYYDFKAEARRLATA